MPKIGEQIAALPMRWDKNGDLQILMVTSRDTGRWVMPKGWEMDGKKPWAAAEIEALEEAGAKGYIGHEAIGTYRYPKIMDDGRIVPCRVRVYPMIVEKLKSDWKERKERTRRWFSPKAAAKRVDEEDLAALLLTLVKKPREQPVIQELLKAS
ncbi:NUDIX hydrolase [Aestuariicoccus sp. MJ-SS9]|uniref:NUDIX hydrolase n=1 Tax=Aestuariicoccus sp. MJ-SS9 TaxID=3079855 RepID=UPI00291446D7|nr:NUDIX hydrolase [Aestuariicoccus sp. MJ-SS9]MDU8909824.1 NUDIX hydrolase [Aestuariicoccus sp. MJ-SS9]